MFPGTVVRVGEDSRSGRFITVKTGAYTISYCHLSQQLVKESDYVDAGTHTLLSLVIQAWPQLRICTSQQRRMARHWTQPSFLGTSQYVANEKEEYHQRLLLVLYLLSHSVDVFDYSVLIAFFLNKIYLPQMKWQSMHRNLGEKS